MESPPHLPLCSPFKALDHSRTIKCPPGLKLRNTNPLEAVNPGPRQDVHLSRSVALLVNLFSRRDEEHMSAICGHIIRAFHAMSDDDTDDDDDDDDYDVMMMMMMTVMMLMI